MKTGLMILVGAICVATAIALAATGGFGVPEGDVALTFSTLGFDGVDDLRARPQGVTAIVLFITGLALMIAANATAWRQTGGY